MQGELLRYDRLAVSSDLGPTVTYAHTHTAGIKGSVCLHPPTLENEFSSPQII